MLMTPPGAGRRIANEVSGHCRKSTIIYLMGSSKGIETHKKGWGVVTYFQLVLFCSAELHSRLFWTSLN